MCAHICQCVHTHGNAFMHTRTHTHTYAQPNVYGISEDDMVHYHNVFADSGNTGAQVSCSDRCAILKTSTTL